MSQAIASVEPNQTASQEQKLIAPLWHTILLVLVILGGSANTYYATQRLAPGRGVSRDLLIHYLLDLAVEWGLVAYVSWPMRRRGITIRKAINARWSNARAVWRDLGIALLVLAGYYLLGLAGAAVLQGHEAKASQTFAQLAPRTTIELLVWIAVAISAGFCEEFVFRGYLQEQCRRLTGSTAAAVVIQAVIFGAVHGWEGWAPMLTIVPIGLFFGTIAAWRKSLAPTMIGHGAADSVGTIVQFLEHVMRRI